MQRDWTNSEKKLSRKIFETALQAELAEIMLKFKNMAKSASEPDDMWKTRDFLDKSQRMIEAKYDFRYSQLDLVFGRLIKEGRISEDDIAGFTEERQALILTIAAL